MPTRRVPRLFRLMKRFFTVVLILLGIGVASLAGYGFFLSGSLTLPRSDDHPSILIYGAPFFLTPGLHLVDSGLLDRLSRLEYRAVSAAPRNPGEYSASSRSLDIFLHAQEEQHVRAKAIRLILEEGVVKEVISVADKQPLPLVALEPVLVSGVRAGSRQVREWIPIDRIPQSLIDTLLAVEDRRFYSHIGVDPLAIGRAFWVNLSRGMVVQGGSTLTQQLAKNLFYSPQRTMWRKVRELAAALALEFKYRKEEILESYLNEIYLGQAGVVSIYGVGEAAHRYFGKTLDELTIDEMALIVGLIKGPNTYSPVKNPDQAVARRNVVLQRLRAEGRLTEEKWASLVKRPIKVAVSYDMLTDAPYFVDYVLREVEGGVGGDTPEGTRIYSTLDPRVQQIATHVLQQGLEKLETAHPALTQGASPLQGAAVVLNVRNGYVLGMVGGRNYRASQFNRAVQAHRSAGSLFKPFVYLAGFEAAREQGTKGLTPATLLADEPVTLESGTGPWSPQNFDKQYRGAVTVRAALEQSLNVPTVRVAHQTGLSAILKTLRGFGITTPLAENLSTALGSSAVSLLDITAAYAGLANGGVLLHPVSLSHSTSDSGEPLWAPPLDRHQAATPQAAYLVTSLLKGVVNHGTGAKAKALGVRGPVAGKTGTTDGYRDAWFVGYSADMAIGIWVGFDDERPLQLTGAQAALPIWSEMAVRLIPRDQRDFEMPVGVVQRKIDPKTGQLATTQCPEQVQEFFIAGTEPITYCEVHGGGMWERLKQTFGLSS